MGLCMTTTADRVLAALQSYDLKPEKKSGEYRINSPLRPGSNSHAFKLTIAADGEHGTYHDHVTHDSGTLYQLAEALNIDTPRATGAAAPVISYGTLADYANEHLGVPAEVLERANWRMMRKDGRPALAFPVGKWTRYRFLDGAKPKYKSETGYEREWYGLEYAANLAIATGQPLIICNGEASTLAAQHRGLPATCVAGGEKELDERHITELRATYQGAVIVALDSDDTGRKNGAAVAQQLRDAGASARAVDMGGGKGFDLADFTRLHGDESLYILLNCKELGAPPRTWLAEDEMYRLAPPRFLVDGVIVFGEVTVVYGLGDAGKTFIVLDMVMRVAQHYNVMYVAGEDAPGIRLRKEAWQKFFKRSPNGKFRLWPSAITLQDNAMIDDFIAQNKAAGSRLIVIDTLSQCAAGADENDNTAMALVMKNATRIAHECQASVIIIHHTDKAGVNYRGAAAIKDNTYGFLKVDKDDDTTVMSCVRIKNTLQFTDRRFQFINVPVDILVDGQVKTIDSSVIAPAQKVYNNGKRLSVNQLKILKAIHMVAKGEGVARTNDIVQYTELKGNSLYKPLNRIKDWGYITRKDRPAGFVLTDLGKEYITRDWEESTGGKEDETPQDAGVFFAVNLDLNLDINRPSTAISTGVSTDASTRMSTVSTADRSEFNRSERLTDRLSVVDMPSRYEAPIGFTGAENSNNNDNHSTVDTSVDSTTSTPSPLPLGKGKGEGEGEVGQGAREVDLSFLRKLAAKGDIAGIRVHCSLRGANADEVIATLGKELGGGDDDF